MEDMSFWIFIMILASSVMIGVAGACLKNRERYLLEKMSKMNNGPEKDAVYSSLEL